MYNYFHCSNYAKGIIMALFICAYSFAQPVPVPSTPLNGSLVYYNTPLISWYFNESSVGLTYQLQVSVVSDFSSVILDTANLPTTAYIFNAESGTQYFWRVRSFSGASPSAWCATFSFSTTGTAPTYTITSSAGLHGTIAPLGVSTLSKHSSQTYTITADLGYHVKDVVVDGVSKGQLTSYTFTDITANHTISAYFTDLWFVTSSAGPNGTISPNGVDSVANNGSITYTVTPDLHYHISAIKVDDSVVGTTSPYTLSTITANHSVTAEFAPDSYSITALVSAGGSITPAGVTTAYYGDSLTYTISANAGYRLDYVLVDGVYQGKITTYTFSGISAPHTIVANFLPVNTFYVSLAGNDLTGTGTELNPFRTIFKAQSVCGPNGDKIIVGDGYFPESVILGPINVSLIGSTNTFINTITVASDSVTIKKINLNGSTLGLMQGILVPAGYKKTTIDSVNISYYPYGIMADQNDGISITNVNVSFSYTIGISVCNSQNAYIGNSVAVNNSIAGIYLKGGLNATVNNVVCNNNNTISLSMYGGGLVVYGTTNGTLSNITTLLNGINGVRVGISNNMTFENIVSSNNSYFGILASSDVIVGDPLPALLGPFSPVINNLKIEGNVTLKTNNMAGLLLWAAVGTNILAPVIDGKISINDSLVMGAYTGVSILGNVINPTFKGIKFKNSFPAFVIQGLSGNLNQPSGVKINNCVFYQPNGAPVILMTGNMLSFMGFCSNKVDARNNAFLNAFDLIGAEAMVIDSVENSTYGRVDISGATFGLNPYITINGKSPAYKGASYYLGVDINPTDGDYYWLRGSMTYDTTKLQYLGFLNNGLINNASWYLEINESPRGKINYNAYGLNAINTSGALFMLNIKVLPAAPGVTTQFAANPLDFYGNLTSGVFGIVLNPINYTDPTGVIQSKGDVTLDGVVNDFDFFALLMHINGVTPLTDPQALINADFDENSVINIDDANALYAFLHPSPAPLAAAPSGNVKFNNIKYNKDGSATIPVAINGASNVRSFELALKYDASKIDYQAFSSAVNVPGYLVQAFKTGEGTAKFVFNAQNTVQGNFYSGDITLKFKNNNVPVGSVIQTNYALNGKQLQKGPDLKFGQDGVTEVKSDREVMPSEFTLYQNYPNPFNPSTTISYYLPDASDVKVVVFDMMGKVVKELVSGHQSAGLHNVVWNAENNEMKKVANGIYFYRINAGSFNSVKKMILLK